VTKALLWLALFSATAVLDWLSARWTDAPSRVKRAHYSALHEAVGYLAGFATYTLFKDITLAVPCILGAWLGSYLGGVDRPPQAVEADLVVACPKCGEAFLQLEPTQSVCTVCAAKGVK
jgi:hypothetical protein